MKRLILLLCLLFLGSAIAHAWSTHEFSDSYAEWQRNAYADRPAAEQIIENFSALKAAWAMAEEDFKLATIGSSTDPLEGLKREWGKATHPSFDRAVTIDELGQALEADSEAFLKFLRSSTLEAALKTALVTRVSLMTAFVGESDSHRAQVLGLLREMADRNDLRQEDLYNLQIMQLAVPVRTGNSVASDKDFQEWMQFAKSPNAAAKAIAVIAFPVLDATEPQRASFYQAFTSETNPILLQRLVRHLKSKSQFSQEASDALNTLRSNLPPDHAAFQDN